MNRFVSWLSRRYGLYRLEYLAWRIVAYLMHILISVGVAISSQAVATRLTTDRFENPIDVFGRLVTIGSDTLTLNLPSLHDVIILLALFGPLSLFLIWLRHRFRNFAVMRTFKSLSRDLLVQSRVLKALLSSLLDAPHPYHIDPLRHDANLNKIKFECATSVLSATAFFTMKVDPDTIIHCFNNLLREPGNIFPSGGIRRIVACSTLTPKEWLNAPLVRYLIATLGLEPTRGLGTTAHKCRYYYLGSLGLDPHDNEILNVLSRIHKMFGFKFNPVQSENLMPIFDYQKEKYGALTPDPAFLYVEGAGASEVLFYRIAFSIEHRGPFQKEWIIERWDPANRSVSVYKSVIDTLCPLPDTGIRSPQTTSTTSLPSA